MGVTSPIWTTEIERLLGRADEAVDRAAARVGEVPESVVRRTKVRAAELIGSL